MSSFPRTFLPKEERPCNDVVDRILSMLCGSAMQNVGSALGIKDVFRKLLIDVENEAIQLLGTSDLLEKLEYAFYRADDLADTFPGGDDKRTAKKQVCTSYRLNRLAREIGEIEKELVEIRTTEFLKVNPRNPKALATTSKVFVGRDEDRKAILKLLLEEDEENVCVVTIVGTGGLGKTELVKVIFSDEQIQKRFNPRLWISGFDSLELDPRLQSYLLPEKEKDRRFLLVIDGVCYVDPTKFEFLRSLLRRGAMGSRVVVTTRSEEVAKACDLDSVNEEDTTTKTYRLKPLDDKLSRILFRATAFKEGEEPYNSKEIMEKCGGNPIVVKTMASMLVLEEAGFDKQSFSQKELLRMPQEHVDAIRMIKSSYRYLPTHLKPCLAYCGLFPKNHEFEVQKLVNLWISQGFIINSSSEFPEDVGYDYFVELTGRLIFEEIEKDESGRVRKCRIRNIMHDLARQVAGIECVTLSLEEKEAIHSKTRHVSFDFHLDSPWQISDLLFRAKSIRTILLLNQLHWQIEGRSGTSICDTIVSNFKYLRTLDLHNSGLKIVSDSISDLRHLRYLDLSQNTDIKKLPDSICGLFCLQSLKLNFCGRLEELPRGMKNLVNLRNLELDSCYSLTHMPSGIGQLTNLQKLSEFVIRNDASFVAKYSVSDQLAELRGLNNLRGELRIRNLSLVTQANEAKLHEKAQLRSLVLNWDMKPNVSHETVTSTDELKPHSNLKELSLFGYCSVIFPSWLPSQTSLVKFSLWKCPKCKHLPALNLLPRLKVLALEDMPDLEHISDDNASHESFFPSLQELRLVDLPRFQSWRSSESTSKPLTFPSLAELTVEDCPKLHSMPLSAELQHLVLKNTVWSPFSSEHSLSELKTLRIVCSSIVGLDKKLPTLERLQSLILDHLPYIKTLPSGLRNLTGLQELHVWRCNGLKGISECVESLESLKKISLKLCLILELPLPTIGLLASKTDLEIEDCPRIENVIRRKQSS